MQQSHQIVDQGGTALDERLLLVLEMVNDWLRFAEAKNAAVLTLSSAAVAVITTHVANTQDLGRAATVFYGLALCCLLIGLVTTLVSLLPQVDRVRRMAESQKPTMADDNLYFFGDLAKYSPDVLVESFARQHADRSGPVEDITAADRAIAGQIVVNARITLWKLHLFSIAVLLFVLSAFVSTIALFLQVVSSA